MPATPPQYQASAFVCPLCEVYTKHGWSPMAASGFGLVPGGDVAQCDHCEQWTVWVDGGLVYPQGAKSGPPPLEGMPAEVAALYEEARDVAGRSARSAAALLRLALQTLIDSLEPGTGDLNTKIGRLAAKGLAPEVQKAMDVLRIVGNNGVHPGQIDLNEDAALLPALFAFLNLIVEQVIVRRETVEALFARLPEGARQAIERRDGTA